MRPFRLASIAALACFFGACGGDSAQPAAIGFTQVYSTIISRRCVPCHAVGDAGPNLGLLFGFLDMSTQQGAYTSLVGVLAMGTSCRASGLTRIVPGSAQTSLLFEKVESPLTMASPPCGDTMPDDGTMLTPADVTLIQTWIDDGARP